MALQPCTYCHRVPRGKLISLIVAWYNERSRIARRLKACLECYPGALAALGEAAEANGEYIQLPEACPACREPILAEELVEVYVTVFGDGETQKPIYLLCAECAAPKLAELASAGEPMTDRPLYSRRRGP
jgi:hypothetical protein